MSRQREYRLMTKKADGHVDEYFTFYSLDPAGMHKVAARLKERNYDAFAEDVVEAWVEEREVITTGWTPCE